MRLPILLSVALLAQGLLAGTTEPIKPMALPHGAQGKEGFMENKGQLIDQHDQPNPAALYLLQGPGYNVQLRASGFSYDLYHREQREQKRNERTGEVELDTVPLPSQWHRIDFDLVGANPGCMREALERSPTHYNFYTVGVPDSGVTFVRSYGRLLYRNVYPNIDLEFIAQGAEGFKYNFVVHPGGRMAESA